MSWEAVRLEACNHAAGRAMIGGYIRERGRGRQMGCSTDGSGDGNAGQVAHVDECEMRVTTAAKLEGRPVLMSSVWAVWHHCTSSYTPT